MLDIEQFADSGELFDKHYKLIRPLSTDGATADVWTALDTNTMSDISQLDQIEGLTEDEKADFLSVLDKMKDNLNED